MKIKKIIIYILLITCYLLFSPRELNSANLTSVDDTLETSRLSFHGANEGALTAGTTVIVIDTANFPSTSTANLFPGDTIEYITTDNTYTVDQVIDSDEFSITSALASADADNDDEFIVENTSQHDLDFTTASAIPNGAIRVRIKADASNNNDGDPDDAGFDFNSLVAGDVTCPTDTGNFDFVTGTATASGDTGCTAGYHCFECRYSGSGDTGTSLEMSIGSTNELINPSPASGHSAGTADSYLYIVENLDASDNVIDSTSGKIAVIESIRVTASVDPTIELTVAGVTADTGTYCGITRDSGSPDSTAYSVPFGSVSITSFTDAQQILTVSTNADGGYVVQTAEDDQMSIGGDSVTEIADTPGDNASASHTTKDEWSTASTKGFGYSLENADANSIAFEYDDSDGTCTGTFCAKQFADLNNSEPIQTLFSSSTVADSENVTVCYRLIIGATQEAGDYENRVTYWATATF